MTTRQSMYRMSLDALDAPLMMIGAFAVAMMTNALDVLNSTAKAQAAVILAGMMIGPGLRRASGRGPMPFKLGYSRLAARASLVLTAIGVIFSIAGVLIVRAPGTDHVIAAAGIAIAVLALLGAVALDRQLRIPRELA